MKGSIELPKAFSIRDDRELPLVRDLMSRLNPMLQVQLVATGVHVNGGPTVHWGLVYLEDQALLKPQVQAALQEAGLDFQHNAEISASRLWVSEYARPPAPRFFGTPDSRRDLHLARAGKVCNRHTDHIVTHLRTFCRSKRSASASRPSLSCRLRP